MCGRLVQATSPDEVAAQLDASGAMPAPPRFNVAPTTPVIIVRVSPETGRRELRLARWGLVPRWAKSIEPGGATMNARAETVHQKPTFREAFKRRRCIVPVTGFFEWKRVGGVKTQKGQPYFVYRTDRRPLLLAGVWEAWVNPESGEEIESVAILTTAPNAFMAALHDRMPVVLGDSEIAVWLDPEINDRDPLESLLATRAWPGVVMHAVTPAMGRVGFEGPQCVQPVALREQGELFGA